jgi:Domain of unknown function (DUF4397)
MNARHYFTLLLSLLALSLSGCGGGDDDNAQIRILNASLDYGPIDVYFDDELKQSNVAYGSVSAFLDYKAEAQTLKITRHGNTSAVYETTATPGKGTKHIYVVYGADGGLKMNQYSENESDASADKSKLRVLNASPDTGSVDLFASTSATEVKDLLARTSGIGYGGVTSWIELDKGSYRTWLTANGDKEDLRLSTPSLTFADKKNYTMVLLPTNGGTLVNAIVFQQAETATRFDNEFARVRLVAGRTNGERIVVNTSQADRILSNASPSISSYVLVAKGATTINLTSNGTAFAQLNATFEAGSDNTLLAYDNANAGAAALLVDNNRAPSQSNRAKVRLVNGFADTSASGLTLNADYSPIASNVAIGKASTYSQITSGTYTRLDVSEASTTTPIYLAKDDTDFASGAVYTFFQLGNRATPIGILRKDR